MLEAVGYRGGKAVCKASRVTAGRGAKIVLRADRDVLRADGVDLVFITAEIQDEAGIPAPTADNEIAFAVEGGVLVGVDNGEADTNLKKQTAR